MQNLELGSRKELVPRSEQGSVWHGYAHIEDRDLEVLGEDTLKLEEA